MAVLLRHRPFCLLRILDRLARQRLELPEAVRPAEKGSAVETKARVWALRWRRRWGLRYGAIPTREDIPVQEMREKAPVVFRTPPRSIVNNRP